MPMLQRLPQGCRLRPSTGGATPSTATTTETSRSGSSLQTLPPQSGTLHRPIPPDQSQGHRASS
eukprot:3527887-Heterocapsa_arctica.AAC.1